MHKSFIITEEDKNRILGMHENATKRQYLNEAFMDLVDKKIAKPGVNKILSATVNWGTDITMLLDGFKDIVSFPEVDAQCIEYWKKSNGYKNIEDMLRGELESDNLSDIVKMKQILDKKGVSLTWGTSSQGTSDSELLDPSTIKIQYKTTTPKTTTPKTNTEKTNTEKTNQQNLPIPSELSTIEDGVRKFQTWMETNHKGWYPGKKPVDGIFGKYTSNAWSNTEYKNEFLKSLSGTSQPVANNPYAGGTTDDDIEG